VIGTSDLVFYVNFLNNLLINPLIGRGVNWLYLAIQV